MDPKIILLIIIILIILIIALYCFFSKPKPQQNNTSSTEGKSQEPRRLNTYKKKKSSKGNHLFYNPEHKIDIKNNKSSHVSSKLPEGVRIIDEKKVDDKRSVIIKTEDNKDLVIPIGSPGRRSPSRLNDNLKIEDVKDARGVIDITPKPPPGIQEEPCFIDNQRSSKGERACRDALWQIFRKHFPRVRPDFLKNP
ncbi:MAG: hypothetical protein Solumvirus8_1, partial [Solumvirus sp.]